MSGQFRQILGIKYSKMVEKNVVKFSHVLAPENDQEEAKMAGQHVRPQKWVVFELIMKVSSI